MGKGEIIAHLGDGRYSVKLLYSRARVEAEISRLNATISAIAAVIAAMDEGQEKELKKLYMASYEKRTAYLEANMPEDEITTIWCADLTEDLSGYVGTMEVPGEVGTALVQPGYDGNATYSTERDGQLAPAIAQGPAGVFVNWALLPHWQKFMPTYRFGEIASIDHEAGTATITLEAAQSSAQNINVNKLSSLTEVTFSYMSCDDGAFEEGDHVLISFEDQDWEKPKVVGFKSEPRACGFQFKLTRGDGVVVDESLSPFFMAKKGTFKTSVTVTATYDTETQYWTILPAVEGERFDDPNGYWISYVVSEDSGITTQYPFRYMQQDKEQDEDRIFPGTYEDEVPFWKIATETNFDVNDFPTGPTCTVGTKVYMSWPLRTMVYPAGYWYCIDPATVYYYNYTVYSSIPYYLKSKVGPYLCAFIGGGNPDFPCPNEWLWEIAAGKCSGHYTVSVNAGPLSRIYNSADEICGAPYGDEPAIFQPIEDLSLKLPTMSGQTFTGSTQINGAGFIPVPTGWFTIAAYWNLKDFE